VIHMPTDGSLPEYAAHVEAYIKEIQSGGAAASDPGMEAIAQGDGFNMEDLKAHLKRCSVTYVQHSGARSFMQQYLLFNEVIAYSKPSSICRHEFHVFSSSCRLPSFALHRSHFSVLLFPCHSLLLHFPRIFASFHPQLAPSLPPSLPPFLQVANSEDVAFHAEPVNLDVSEAGLTGRSKVDTDDGLYMVRMAISNSLPLSAVDKIVQLMRHRKISVRCATSTTRLHALAAVSKTLACERDPRLKIKTLFLIRH